MSILPISEAPSIDTQLVGYVVTSQGTDFTIDVTAANLLEDTTVKDFVVVSLTNNQVFDEALFIKVSPMSIKYVGEARPEGEQLEVQRRTPVERYQYIRYKALFDSAIYNEEIQRIWRRLTEAELVGIGPGSGVSTAPVDEPYGVSWASDVFRSRVAKNIYDKIEMLVSDIADNAIDIVNNSNAIVDNSTNITALGQQVASLGSSLGNAAMRDAENTFTAKNYFQEDMALISPKVFNINGLLNFSSTGKLQLNSGALADFKTGSSSVFNGSFESRGAFSVFSYVPRFHNSASIRNSLHVVGGAGEAQYVFMGPAAADYTVDRQNFAHSHIGWTNSGTLFTLERIESNFVHGGAIRLSSLGISIQPKATGVVSVYNAGGSSVLDVHSNSPANVPYMRLGIGYGNASDVTNFPHSVLIAEPTTNSLSIQSRYAGGSVANALRLRPTHTDISKGLNFPGWWYDNAIYLGWSTTNIAVKIDNSDLGFLAFVTPSDRRLKKDIVYMTPSECLEHVQNMKPCNFSWKSTARSEERGTQYGLIAQDLKGTLNKALLRKVPMSAESNIGIKDESDHHLIIEYAQIVPLLIGAVQDLLARVEALQPQA